MTTTILAAVALGTVAIAYGIGRVRGHRNGIKSVLNEIEFNGTFHGFGHVIVGYKVSLADWISGRNIPKTLDPFQDTDKAGTDALKHSAPKVVPLGIEPDLTYHADPGNAQHASQVIVKGIHGYEHPFLNTGSQG